MHQNQNKRNFLTNSQKMDFEKIEKICVQLATTRKDLNDQLAVLKRTNTKIKQLRQQERTQITMMLHHVQPPEH